MPIQVFNPTPVPSTASMIGSALGQGIAKNFPDPQQMVQRGLLQEAMAKLPKNASHIDMLKIIGPQLLTTPGGAQLLAEMGPLLQKSSQANAYLEYLKQNQSNQASQPGQPGTIPQTQGQVTPVGQPTEIKPGGEEYFRKPKPPVGAEGTYPKMSALPEPIPLMTPQERDNELKKIITNMAAQGGPVDVPAAENIVDNKQTQRMAYNQKIEEERGIREEKQQKQTARMLTRFENSDLQPKSSEDKVVFEKFSNEAKDAANENDAYQYARAKYKQFDNARNGLIREADLPGFAEKLWRKSTGTFKNKEAVFKDLQPHIKQMKDLGLENEAREILSTQLGMGMEDTERAMYPPTKQETSDYLKFSNNPNYKEGNFFEGEGLLYPGEESALPREKFMKLKDDISSFLEKNPGANLVVLRGVLNHDKKYSWVDIGTSIAELIDEGRFVPDNIQEQQFNVVKSPPRPGMGEVFKDVWRDTR